MGNEDPYRYFRIEAREILDSLGREVLDLEKGEPNAELIGRLLRQAHTLKGAARVVKLPQVADVAHAMEEVLAPYRDAPRAVSKEQVGQLLHHLDAISAELAAVGSAPGTAGGPSSAPPAAPTPNAIAESFEQVRVETADLETLLEKVSETAVQIEHICGGVDRVAEVEKSISALARELTPNGAVPGHEAGTDYSAIPLRYRLEELSVSLRQARHNLLDPADAARRELGRVRESAERMRLLPARLLYARMERAVRDAAANLGKLVEFQSAGGDERLESRVLSVAGEALLHLVRNAVAHGIESPADRVAAGKPPCGVIRLSVERRGRRVAFVCSDDGRGIDLEAVRRAAISRGVVSAPAASALSARQLIDLLLARGLTTTESAGAISGRGIGLTVVAQASAELSGHTEVHTETGRGTTVKIDVPLSLSSLTAMLVDAAGVPVWFPLDTVQCTARFKATDVANTGGRESVLFEGNAIPFLRLAPLLHAPIPLSGPAAMRSVLIVRLGAELLAVGVERVIRTADVIVHPLASNLAAVALLGGAAFDAEGNVQLVIDPAALSEAAASAHAPEVRDQPPAPHILVIDDSLTSRMLEQSVLASGGYQVDVAATAEEALIKAHEHRYSLFVCDVEMPGMDGFEFVKRTRESDELRSIPSIMVTMRTGEEDRKHAADVGVRAYMCKSEFDERSLLSTVRELLG